MKKPVKSRFVIEIPILVLAGILLWYLTSQNTKTPQQNVLPDILFAVGSIFLIRGIIALLGRSHAFSHTSDSFRFVHRLFRGKKAEEETESAGSCKADKPESDRRTVSVYLIIAAILIIASVLTGAF